MNFSFQNPWLLLLLLLLPLAAWLRGQRGPRPSFVYSSVALLKNLGQTSRSRAGALLIALRWLALALIIVALARPQKTQTETSVRASGVDIVIALDLSGSMESEAAVEFVPSMPPVKSVGPPVSDLGCWARHLQLKI